MDDDESDNVEIHELYDHEHEPQLDSNDPNERKLARRLRIERRWEIIVRRQCVSLGVLDEEEKKEFKLQVQKSADILEKFIHQSEEYVTHVRVTNDAREADRRYSEGIGREKVMEQLEKEAAAAQNMFHEMVDKWTQLKTYTDPLNTKENIMNQNEKCDLLIKQKDGVIALLKDALKKAEKNIAKDQEKQMQDINILTKRIEKQVTFMRHAYRKEFELIEAALFADRRAFMDVKTRDWDELYKKRDCEEAANSDKKFQQLEDLYHIETNMRLNFQEQFRKTKITLSNDIDNLQKELEKIKALTLDNGEKLDYNYQILKKREDENIVIKSQQKRKINKLQDIINDLRRKISDYETTANNRIKKLTDNIAKLHHNIIQVEEKADHFAIVNDEKFHQVWEINKEHCESILKKLLDTDKVLHEQQMGIPWTAPPLNIVPKAVLPSFKMAKSICAADMKEIKDTQSIISGTSRATKRTDEVQSEQAKAQVKLEMHKQTATFKRLVKYIIMQLSDKSGFLTENRFKLLIKYFEDDQKSIVRVDNIFESLGIHDQQDIEILISYFMPYTYCPKCQAADNLIMPKQSSLLSRYISRLSASSHFSRRDRETIELPELEHAFFATHQPASIIEEVVLDLVASEEFFDDMRTNQISSESTCGEPLTEQYSTEAREKRATTRKTVITDDRSLCQYNHPLLISSVYVLRALREFVEGCYLESEGLPTTGERLERRRRTVSRELHEDDIRDYWERYKTVYNKERIRVWDGLLEGLRKFHEILKDRETLCNEVVHLRKQNEDLKKLLANYNDQGEHMTPPCAIEYKCLKSTVPHYTNTKM